MNNAQTIVRPPFQNIVLEEIRRIAQRDGDAPGIQAFVKETGITKGRIIGVLWAKWGDALIEAGYQPKVLQVRFDDEHVLREIATAFRKFGRIPSTAELRLHAAQTPGFPAHNTLTNRFDGRADMLGRLAKFVAEKEEFSTVKAMLDERPQTQARQVSPVRSEGTVYLIRFGPHYKIGRSNDGFRRAREIKTLLPEDGEIIHFITTDDPVGIEAYWHNRFKDQRLRGEWFKLSASDVAAFKRRRFQ